MNIEQREFVKTYEITPELFSPYGLTVEEMDVIRETIKVSAKEGTVGFKKYKKDKKQFQVLLETCLYLQERGFVWLPTVLPNQFSSFYIQKQQDLYYFTSWIQGKNLNALDPEELEQCAGLLAAFHKAGEGFFNDDFTVQKKEDLLLECKEKKNRLLQYKEQVLDKKEYTQFDLLFIESVDEACESYEKAYDRIKELGYEKLLHSALRKGQLVHGDYRDCNLVWSEEQQHWHIADFEHIGYGTRIRDLYYFIHHCNMVESFKTEQGTKCILEAYEEKIKLTKLEKQILEVLCTLPEKFYEISTLYYQKLRNWEEEVYVMYLK